MGLRSLPCAMQPIAILLFSFMLFGQSIFAQGLLSNGGNHQATLTVSNTHAWTFTANANDSFVLRAAVLQGTNGFSIWLRVFGPGGQLLGQQDGHVSEVATNVALAGTYTVLVGDGGTYFDGEGNYRLQLGLIPGEFIVPSADEGGPAESGGNHDGEIPVGDLDMWTFEADAGASIIVRAAVLEATNGFSAWLRAYDPSGVLVQQEDASVSEVAFTATNGGIYTILLSDGGTYFDGEGKYRLRFAITPGERSGFVHLHNDSWEVGDISLGDLDLYWVHGRAGQTMRFDIRNVNSLSGSLWAGVRVFTPGGGLAVTHFTISDYGFNLVTTNEGIYCVIVSDASTYRNATGTYEMRVSWDCGSLFATYFDDGSTNRFPDSLRFIPSIGSAEPIGVVADMEGSATIIGTNGVGRAAFVGALIYFKETLNTALDSSVRIVFCNGDTFIASQNSSLNIDEYVYDPTEGGVDFSILKGIFRWFSPLLPDPETPLGVPVGIGSRGDASDYMNPENLDIAVTMNAASPVTLYTAIVVTNQPFQLEFDYAFLQPTGSLSVSLGNMAVLSLEANLINTPYFLRNMASLSITNPAVLALGLAELNFTFNGPVGAQVFLDKIVMPGLLNGDFTNFDAGWFSRGHGNVDLVASVRPLCSVFTQLYVQHSGDQVICSWPLSATNYILETTTSIALPISWSVVTNSVTVTTNSFSVVLPRNANPTFYRLRLQCN